MDIDLIQLFGTPQHGKCEVDSAAGQAFKMICRRASYQQKEVINCFEDACRVVNKHATEVGASVKKLYQVVSDETIEKLQEKNKNVVANVGKYKFAGIKKTYMIAFRNVRDMLVRRQGTSRAKTIQDKFTVLTKPMISPLATEWVEKKIKVDKDQIKKNSNGFYWK